MPSKKSDERFAANPSIVYRLCLLLGGTLLSIFALLSSISAATQISNPAISLRFESSNAVAKAVRADQIFVANGGRRSNWVDLAKQSLRDEPINPRAVRLLHSAQLLSKKKASANALLALADRITRRDVLTQILLVEANVEKDDIGATLKHYDTALTTSIGARDILFPILAEAMSDQSILTQLATMFKNERPWRIGFLYHAGFKPERLDQTLWLLNRLGPLPKDATSRAFERQMLTQLTNLRRYPEARSFFKNMQDAPLGLLTTFSFENSVRHADLRPIAWDLNGSGNADVQLVTAGGDGEHPHMSAHVWSGPTSTLARKLAFLSPGRYTIQITTQVNGLAKGGLMEWTASCARREPSNLIGDVVSTDNREDWSKSVLQFSVTPDCQAVELALLVNAGDSQNGADILVRDFEVKTLH
jgi:hypothetical protein